ncbi:MAG: T9SS type A sorting domain-containing protein [Flavobacteriales bacterium]
MRYAALIVGLLVEALAFGQGFNKRYDAFGLEGPQGSFGIEYTPAGYAVLGASEDLDSLGPDSFFFHASVVLTFIDDQGVHLSTKRAFRPWQNTAPGWANCCDTIPGGGFIIGAGSQDTVNVFEVYLMRFDAQGDTIWTRAFGGAGEFWIGRQVKRTPDGGFLVVGDTDANGNTDGFVLKTDGSGEEEWRETYSGGGLSDYLMAIDMVGNGDYFCGGQRRMSVDDKDLWVLRIDSTGAVRWTRSWGSSFDEPNAHLITLADGHVLVASAWGYADEFNAIRPYLAKLDSTDGSTIWDHEYGPIALGTSFFAAKERNNGDIIACGVSYVSFHQQGLLLRATSTGDSLWMRTYYYQDTLIADGTGRFYDVLPTDDGGFIAAGVAYNPAGAPYPPGYSADTWVVKVDSLGCIVPGCDAVGVQEVVTNLGNSLTVYPNPAHGSATMEVQLPQSMHGNSALRLVLVNGQGQVAMEQAGKEGGNTLDLSGIAAGLYYVHLANGTTWLAGAKLVVE